MYSAQKIEISGECWREREISCHLFISEFDAQREEPTKLCAIVKMYLRYQERYHDLQRSPCLKQRFKCSGVILSMHQVTTNRAVI